MRKIEILIVVAGLVVIVALVFGAVGCKDEAEAVEEGTFDITLYSEPEFEDANYIDVTFCYDHNGVTEELTLNVVNGEIICSRSPKKAIEIIFKTMYYNWGERNKGDVYDLPVRFPEPKEPAIIELSEKQNIWICSECAWLDEHKELLKHLCPKSEPNEPLLKIETEVTDSWLNIWESNEIQKVSLDFIPTWPDYIELEKELIIIWPDDKLDLGGVQLNYQPKVTMSKGTKIYFKE